MAMRRGAFIDILKHGNACIGKFCNGADVQKRTKCDRMDLSDMCAKCVRFDIDPVVRHPLHHRFVQMRIRFDFVESQKNTGAVFQAIILDCMNRHPCNIRARRKENIFCVRMEKELNVRRNIDFSLPR